MSVNYSRQTYQDFAEDYSTNQYYQYPSYRSNNDYNHAAKRSRWDSNQQFNQKFGLNSRKRIVCYTCGRTFPNYNILHKHREAEHGKKYYCSTCNKECSSYYNLKRHEASHTMHACQKCPEVFKYMDSLVCHVAHAHPNCNPQQGAPTMIPAIGNQQCEPPTLPAITSQQHPPKSPDSGTKQAEQFSNHPPNLTTTSRENPNGSVDKNEPTSFSEPTAASTPHAKKKDLSEEHGDSDSGVKMEQFQCPHCIKSFDSERKMTTHCKIHTEAETGAAEPSEAEKAQTKSALLTCPFCIKQFPARRELLLHMSSVHTQVFFCLKCPAEFGTQSELIAHQSLHPPSTQFCCWVCSSNFESHPELVAHQKRHTNEAFICSGCSAKFGTQPELTAHQKVHPLT